MKYFDLYSFFVVGAAKVQLDLKSIVILHLHFIWRFGLLIESSSVKRMK